MSKLVQIHLKLDEALVLGSFVSQGIKSGDLPQWVGDILSVCEKKITEGTAGEFTEEEIKEVENQII